MGGAFSFGFSLGQTWGAIFRAEKFFPSPQRANCGGGRIKGGLVFEYFSNSSSPFAVTKKASVGAGHNLKDNERTDLRGIHVSSVRRGNKREF